ncbi:MAG TPA: YciI family protein [Alphaproteobacteria bacterium]|nr:YciI family protein [Alphaproteobacteria bacterium]
MRFMIMVKEGETPPEGPPSSEMIAAMGRLNQEMIEAGVLLAMEGLLPSRFGRKVKFTSRDRRQTIDGPFSETKELIGGFWIIEAKDMDEVMGWVSKIPFENGEEIEIRRVAEIHDFERNEITAEALDLERAFQAERVRPIKG